MSSSIWTKIIKDWTGVFELKAAWEVIALVGKRVRKSVNLEIGKERNWMPLEAFLGECHVYG